MISITKCQPDNLQFFFLHCVRQSKKKYWTIFKCYSCLRSVGKKKPKIAFNIFSPDMLLSFPPSILNLLCLFFLINHSHCRNHHGKRRTMYIAKSLPRSELTLKVYKINPIQDAAFCDRYLLNDPEEWRGKWNG